MANTEIWTNHVVGEDLNRMGRVSPAYFTHGPYGLEMSKRGRNQTNNQSPGWVGR